MKRNVGIKAMGNSKWGIDIKSFVAPARIRKGTIQTHGRRTCVASCPSTGLVAPSRDRVFIIRGGGNRAEGG